MRFATVGSILMLCGLAGVLFGILYCDPVVHSSPPVHNVVNTNNYAIVLDCDDNLTTAFVYKWGSSADGEPVVVLATNDFNVPLTKRVYGGIARFALNATLIYNYLDPLIKWAKSVIPESSEVSIHAKIRDNMLPLTSWERFRLLNPINSKFMGTGFRFKGSFVGYLSLEEQAVFSLQSVNSFYGDQELTTYGSLTLGRHEISKAYLPMAQAYEGDINIGARLHDVKVRTSYHLGMEDIRNKIDLYLLGKLGMSENGKRTHPCLSKGVQETIIAVDDEGVEHTYQAVGSGDFQQCSNLMSRYFNLPTQQSFDGQEKKYVAVDKYNFIKKMFCLGEEASVADLKQKVEAVCSQTPHYGFHSASGEQGGHHAASGEQASGEQGGHHAASGEQGGHHPSRKPGGHHAARGERGGSLVPMGEQGGIHSGGVKGSPGHGAGHTGYGGNWRGAEKGGRHHWNHDNEGGEEQKENAGEKEGTENGGRHHKCGERRHRKHGGEHHRNGTHNGESGENGWGHRRCQGGRNWWVHKCFVGTYTVSLLEYMYGFTNDHANDKIIWKDISWTHGYVLSEVAAPNSRISSHRSAAVKENVTGIVVLLVSVSLMLVGLIFFMLERRIHTYMPLRSDA